MPNNKPSTKSPNPNDSKKRPNSVAANRASKSPIRAKQSPKTIIKLIVIVTLVIVAIGYLTWDIVADGPLTRLLTNRDELIAAVRSWGIFGPLLYVSLQVIQTIVAPIPGQIVGSIGGFIFGPWGILWTSIGTLLGCYIVFKISKRFGRRFLEKIFKPSAIARFDFIINSKSAAVVLFLVFLLPGFPDDIVCYIAGLTTLPIRKLMVILLLGRLPLIIVTNYLGSGITTNLEGVIIVSIVAVVLLGLGLWQRERILALLKKHSLKHTEEAENQKDSKK